MNKHSNGHCECENCVSEIYYQQLAWEEHAASQAIYEAEMRAAEMEQQEQGF